MTCEGVGVYKGMGTCKGVGCRIKELRSYLGLSLADFGNAIGYTATHVSRLEKGGTEPKKSLLKRISETFSVNPSYFEDRGIRIEDAVQKPVEQAIINAEVSARLKSARRERGLKQKELAEIAGVENALISGVENHNRLLTEPMAKKLADALMVGVDWLLYGVEGKKEYPVNDEMIDWLWTQKQLRKNIWEQMKSRTVLSS